MSARLGASRRRWGLLLAVLVVAVSAGVFVARGRAAAALLRADPDMAPASPALMRPAVAAGARVYAAHCAGCHGAGGRGDRRLGAPDLTDDDWLYGRGEVSDIERVVEHGVRAYDPKTWNLAVMPAFASPAPAGAGKGLQPLTPPDIRDVVEFLRASEGRSAEPQAVSRGSAIYSGRGGCYDCHGADLRGDPAIGAPNLSDDIWLYGDGSRAALFQTLARGRQGVCPAWSGRLSPVRIRQAALYVYSLSHARPAAPARAGTP